jgi:exodeoxyribonuclease VII small subunit
MTKTTNAQPKNPQPAVADAGDVADPKAFETSLGELEAIVERLEQGELSLEEALAAFEHGIRLTRACQQALDRAEQRVRILTDGTSNDPAEGAPQFQPEPDPAMERGSEPPIKPDHETRPRAPRKRPRSRAAPRSDAGSDQGLDADSELPF